MKKIHLLIAPLFILATSVVFANTEEANSHESNQAPGELVLTEEERHSINSLSEDKKLDEEQRDIEAALEY